MGSTGWEVSQLFGCDLEPIIESKLEDSELVSHIVANLGLSEIKIDPDVALQVVKTSRRSKPPIS